MKKHLLISLFCFLTSFFSQSQNLNVTLSDQLTYSGQSLANIWGWKDPQDGKEYALVGASNGLSIVDVTNPANVFQVTQIAGPNCTWREVKTVGNYAYVTSECGSYGLQIINLINLPATNLQTATWTPNLGTPSTKLTTIHALHADGGKVYLYGSNVGNKGCIIADVTTNPMAPAYLGSYDPKYIHDGYVRNDTLYAGHINAGECAIVKTTNPSSPQLLASFNTPGNFTHNTWLSKDSKICFTTDEVNNSFLASFDISNFSNIAELDRIQSNPGSNSVVHNTHIINVSGNDFAVTSWYNDGFTIVDAGRPSNLVQVGNYDTAPTSSGSGMQHDWGVYPYLPSGIIVASDESNGLFVCAPTYVRASYLEGTIMNCSTGNPLSGAKVQIMNPPTVNVNSATDISDALGKYGVGVATAGTYTVTVSKQAYVSQTFTVAVTSGNVTILNVNLCPQTPPFSYTGNVFDNATTIGIPGVSVHMQDNAIVWDTVTDANGNFTIPGMLGGTYDIIVGKWGYITKCLSGQNINSSSTPVSIGLSKGIYDDFSFDFGWTVSGACSNNWERGIPVGTIDNANGNATANPDKDDQTDCSNQCYVTDNGGGAVSDHDVDPPGYTILTSPVFNPTIYTDPVVSYTRWFYDAKLQSNLPNDTMDIYISNGSTTVLLERMINNSAGNGKWCNSHFRIANFLTPSATMQISLSTSDAGPGGTIVEGGLDKFFVYDSSAVGVNNITSDNENVIIYPNPSNGEFTIYNSQNGNYNLELYNVLGEKVYSEKIVNRQSHTIYSDLSSGMYFYKIIFDGKESAKGKLLIE